MALLRSLKPMFLVLVLAALTSCSFVSLAYRNLDWILMSRIDDFFDLSSSQEKYLEPKIKDFTTRLKKRDLPQVFESLEALTKQLTGSQANKDLKLNEFVDELNQLKVRLIRENIAVVSTFLGTLSPKQIVYFKEQLAEANDKTAKLAEASPKNFKGLQEERFDKRLDQYEDWVGDLSKSQRSLIFDHDRGQSYFKSYLQFRKGMQLKFINILDKYQNDPVRRQARLQRFLLSPKSFASASEKEFIIVREARWQQRLDEFSASLTTQQRRHLASKISNLVRQLQG